VSVVQWQIRHAHAGDVGEVAGLAAELAQSFSFSADKFRLSYPALLATDGACVLVAAARSRRGASFALVSSIPAPEFQPCLSVGLYAELQDLLTRPENVPTGRTPDDALGFVRYLASHAHLQEIHFLWRPFLADADDDMVLELAVAAGCGHIITHNVKDFHGSEQFGVTALASREFLSLIRKKP